MPRPCVLLVPGGSASCEHYFEPLHAPLAEVATVVRHDRVGTGSNPRRGPVTLAEQARDLHEALQAAGGGPAVVVAHSYGGPVTLQLALDFPDDVASVVLLDPTPISSPKELSKLVKSVAVLSAVCRAPGMRKAFGKLAAAKIRKECKDLDKDADFAVGFSWTDDLDEVPRLAALLSGFPADAELLRTRLAEAGGLGCPGVIVTADRKRDHKMRLLHDDLQDRTGLEIVSWEGTTHILHGQRPGKVVELVREQLGAVSA